jgi:hypothetical protein
MAYNYGRYNQVYRQPAYRQAYQPAQTTAGVPYSPTGYWTVRAPANNVSYTYSDANLAARCLQTHPGWRIEGRSSRPDMKWAHTFNRRF